MTAPLARGGPQYGDGKSAGISTEGGERNGIAESIYSVCILVGLGASVLSLILGGHADLDVSDVSGIDASDAGGAVMPFHFTAFLFALVVFGAVGRFSTAYPLIGFAAALLCGAAAYVLIYRFIVLPLRRSDARAMSVYDAVARRATVITKIPVNGTGEVRLRDRVGATITYLARYRYADFEPHVPIEVGADVEVVDTEDGLLIVERAE